jgi:RNA recognition motif-containing protein
MIRLFVGGLPATATRDDVFKLFRQFGAREETIALPRDRRTHRKKGVAFVELESTGAAEAAIAMFHGFEISGKSLTVCLAAERPAKPMRSR